MKEWKNAHTYEGSSVILDSEAFLKSFKSSDSEAGVPFAPSAMI